MIRSGCNLNKRGLVGEFITIIQITHELLLTVLHNLPVKKAIRPSQENSSISMVITSQGSYILLAFEGLFSH